MQLFHARDDGDLCVDLDGCAHAVELGAIAEARVIDALRNDAHAGGKRHAHGDLRLHVRREAGIRHRLDIGPAHDARALHADGVVVFGNLHAHLAQLGGDAVHMFGDDVLDKHVAARGRDGRHIGARLDLVRNDGVAAAVQAADAANFDDVGTRARDLRAHGVQEVRQIDDVRFLCGVLDNGRAVRQDCADHDVHGRADGDDVEIDTAARQAVCRGGGADEAILEVNGGTDGLEALDVLVDGARAEVAAAGQRHAGMAEAAELRADEIIGGADTAHQRVGGLRIAHICAAELQRIRTQAADLCAHAVQNLQQEPDIGDIRHIFDAAGAVYEQCCRKNRHGGVFCAADGYDAGQRMAALDNVFIHVIPSHDRSICNMSQNNSANFRQPTILPTETFSWKALSTV